MKRIVCEEKEVRLDPPSGYNLVHDLLFRSHQNYRTNTVYFIKLGNINISRELVFWKNLRIIEETYLNIQKNDYFRKWSNRIKFLALNIFKRRRKEFDDTYLWAIDRFSQGYYHWITEALPRILFLQREKCSNKLLLTTKYIERRYVHETLELLKIDKEYIDLNNSYGFVHNLCMITPFTETGLNNPLIIKDLQKTVIDLLNIDIYSENKKRIFVSRRKAQKRKLLNEVELRDVFEEFGIESVCFEDYSFREQVRIAYESELMIGLHGSGLTNCLFMQEGSTLLEIRNDSDPNFCFYTLSKAVDLNYYFLAYKTKEWAMTKCEIMIEINEFRDYLKKICEKS